MSQMSLGHSLGILTVNIPLCSLCHRLSSSGVYAGKTSWDGEVVGKSGDCEGNHTMRSLPKDVFGPSRCDTYTHPIRRSGTPRETIPSDPSPKTFLDPPPVILPPPQLGDTLRFPSEEGGTDQTNPTCGGLQICFLGAVLGSTFPPPPTA